MTNSTEGSKENVGTEALKFKPCETLDCPICNKPKEKNLHELTVDQINSINELRATLLEKIEAAQEAIDTYIKAADAEIVAGTIPEAVSSLLKKSLK